MVEGSCLMKHIIPVILVMASWVTWLPGVTDSTAASESEGSWTVGAPASTKRTEVAVAELNGKIYVVGGFEEPDVSNALNYGITKVVEVYDPKTDSWTTTSKGASSSDKRMYSKKFQLGVNVGTPLITAPWRS